LKPCDEPKLTLKIEGQEIPFLVDTGATKSALRKSDFPNAPLSRERVKVVGMSGVACTIPLTEQLRVEIGPLSANHAFLMATDTPINLLGRDLLCKLNCTVKCTPGGVYLEIPHESHITMMNLLQENTENLVYQWTVINCEAFNYLQEYLSHLERNVPEVCDWVSKHHMDRQGVQTPLHCIADCNVKGKLSKLHQTFELALGTIWIGKQGIGLEVHLTQEQLKLWNQPSSVTPHVTLAIAEGYQETDIGHMVTSLKKASQATLTESSQVNGLWKIGEQGYCWSECRGTAKAVFEMVDLLEINGSEKLPEILEQVPTCLWATHANDVGRIRGMHPVKITIDPEKTLPRRPQYPL